MSSIFFSVTPAKKTYRLFLLGLTYVPSYTFWCGSLEDSFSSSDCTTSDFKSITLEWRIVNWTVVENLRYYPSVSLNGPRKIMKNLINSNSYLPNTSPDHYLYTNPFDSLPSSSSPIRIIRLTFCLYISFQDSLTPKPTPFSSHQCRVSPLLMVFHDVWRERKSERHATPPETPTDSLPELWE